jgi:hypothetical protein
MNTLAGSQVGLLQVALIEDQPVNLPTCQLETNLL